MIVYKELCTIEKELGFSSKTLYGISNNLKKHYHLVNIPKKDGGVRTLSVPDEILKSVQKAIAEKLLSYENVSFYAKAYKYNSSIIKNASPHVGKGKILKLDIYHFFDNIMYTTVKDKVFSSEKYSEKIRILLSMLCYYNDVLPQGAPSSPIITNIIMYEFDETLGNWCKERKIDYTRYCDDLTFSGDFNHEMVIEKVKSLLFSLGLKLNYKKTKVFTSSKRQEVTGIVVNQKENIAKEYRREIRKELFFCQKYGTEAHLKHEGLDITPSKYLNKLLGKINYVLQIRPSDEEFHGYKKTVIQLSKLLKDC